MALGFVDGFDHYASADALQKWTGFSVPGPVTSTVYARGTGQGMSFSTPSGARYIYRTVWPAGSATVTMGTAILFLGLPGTISPFLMFTNGSTEQCSVRGDGAGKLTVCRGTNVLATSTNAVNTGIWYYIEFKATVATGTGGTVELRVNGTSTGWVASTGSLNTANAAVANATGIGIGGIGSSAANTAYYDDLYALDSSGSTNTTFLGDCRVATLRPQAAGNYAQWTSNGGTNFANVADDPYYDADTSFNQSATANQIDSFVFDDIPAASGSVFGIQHVLWAKKDVGAARTFAALQRSSGVDYVGTTQNAGTSYGMYLDLKETNPATSAAWDVAGVNGAEWGYKILS